MTRLVQIELSQAAYDAVIASELGTAVYVPGRGQPARILEDVELGAYLPDKSNRNRSGLAQELTWLKFAQFLRRLAARFDLCTVVSNEERAALVAVAEPSTRIALVPNGVDCAYYSEQSVQPQADTLIFNGALSYYGNHDAVTFFLNDIWPLIKRRRPQAQLIITGRPHSVAIKGLSIDNGVTATGYLDDIRPAVQGSMVCVVPMRVGAGSRVKILEAMALGTPVVSTTKGAEGLEVTHGENVLIADKPDDFAERICEVLENPALHLRLGQNGRRLVQAKYDWKLIGDQFESLLEATVAEKAA